MTALICNNYYSKPCSSWIKHICCYKCEQDKNISQGIITGMSVDKETQTISDLRNDDEIKIENKKLDIINTRLEIRVCNLEKEVFVLHNENKQLKEENKQLKTDINILKTNINILETANNESEFTKIASDNISKFLNKLDDKLNEVTEYKNFEKISVNEIEKLNGGKTRIKRVSKTNMGKFFKKLYNTATIKGKIDEILKSFGISESFMWYALDLKNGRNVLFHTDEKLTKEQIDMYVPDDMIKEEFKGILCYI